MHIFRGKIMLSVTILTKNSAKTLKKTLESVQRFPEVLVLDSGSSDDTLEIASLFSNVKICSTSFCGFGPLHNEAAALARYPWIFSIDSDEIVSPSLVEELLSLPLQDPSTVYAIIRNNYFHQKHIKGCSGWYPDWVIRLYNKNHTSFSQDLVHEKVVTEKSKVLFLQHPLIHEPYQDMASFFAKMNLYSDLFSQSHSPSLSRALASSFYTFFKSYILKKGFRAGKEGFFIAIYQSHVAFYKYARKLFYP